MKNILKKIMTGILIMIAAMGFITPVIAQATDETVTIDKEEYSEYKEYQDYKKSQEKHGKDTEIDKNEKTQKKYKKIVSINGNLIEYESISEKEFKAELERTYLICMIVLLIFSFAFFIWSLFDRDLLYISSPVMVLLFIILYISYIS